MAGFGPKLQFLKLSSATCESRSRPPPLSFLLKLCVIVLHTHRYHPPKFHSNVKHHDGGLIFSHFARVAACCLLLACLLACCCCLLAAAAASRPGRSTLDIKKGYKIKTVSTSSVTLIKTEYWDRAGGGGNISYDRWGTSGMIHTLMALDKLKSACKSTPSPQGPLSRLFGLLRGQNAPKWSQNGLNSPVCAPQMV